MNVLVLLPLLALPAALDDDVVPAAIEAQLALPTSPFSAGAPLVPDGPLVFALAPEGTVRAAASLDDVTGDGAADLAVGFGPDALRAVAVVDGASGATLWSRAEDGRSVRARRALVARDGRLALGLCGPDARVELRDARSGTLLWTRDLAPGAGSANVLSVEAVPDLDGDGLGELLCAGGAGAQVVTLLAGADGSPLWAVATPGPCADARLGADLSGDGLADVLAVGGLSTPFALALHGGTGVPVWQAPLPAPASVVLPHVDVDGDGLPDLLVGLFASPGPCVRALSGATGSTLWSASDLDRDVTALVAVSDVDGDGLADACVASLENAMSCVGAAQGAELWRQETSDTNSGSLLDVVAIGDADGNGFVDVLAPSLDRRAYVFDGRIGVYMLAHDARARCVVAGTLPGRDGDGRPALLAAGQHALDLVGADGGLLAGPVLDLSPADTIEGESTLVIYSYPTSTAWVLASAGPPVPLAIQGFGGTLAIDLSAFAVLLASKTPGAGVLGYLIPPLPREALGLTLQLQAVSVWNPGHGLIGPPLEWTVGG